MIRPIAMAVTATVFLVGSFHGPRHDDEPAMQMGEFVRGDAASRPSPEDLTDVVQRYCVRCHNDRRMTGNLSLDDFDVARAPDAAETVEKMIVKLRAEMMPPPGAARPVPDTLSALVETLEHAIDEAALGTPNPGTRTFQRLNRAEYEAAVQDLLGLDIDAADFLPPDPRSASFDNIADAQLLSPVVLDSYLRAAASISRLAVGEPDAAPTSVAYTNSGYRSQWSRMPGAPRGTRGGVSAVHNFPADGEYTFEMWFEHGTTGSFLGTTTPGEQIDVSIDGEQVALLDVDRWMSPSDPAGASMSTNSVFVTAGPHRVSAAFVELTRGPLEDLTSPHAWSIPERSTAATLRGMTGLAHMKDLYILGPRNPTGVSETPSRRKIFTCYPASEDGARPCAERIISQLGAKAFRRPLNEQDIEDLMTLYDRRSADGGFEIGVRTALQGILSMPDFLLRLEEAPPEVSPGETYRISDFDLASRLSFFLWGRTPDQELIDLAEAGRLSDDSVLRQQVRRMLADARAEALGSRFAAQWLRLADLYKVQPDRQMYPDFHLQLADAMIKETEMFFNSLVREDRSMFELFAADYSYMNERLADNYGIPGVSGEYFRRVQYPDDSRRGILGHGSVLMSTSHANRTSPVLRGKWIMEVVLGTPPPPPPPGVPPLDDVGQYGEEGRQLTTRERMELHRANPSCSACHQYIDPIGLALENFDVMGRWRHRENTMLVDTRGELYDGTPVTSAGDLRSVFLGRPIPVVRNFTSNLMAYALGRRVEYYDMPTVRDIASHAESQGYRMSAFIMGIVESDAFQMKRAPTVAVESQRN